MEKPARDPVLGRDGNQPGNGICCGERCMLEERTQETNISSLGALDWSKDRLKLFQARNTLLILVQT